MREELDRPQGVDEVGRADQRVGVTSNQCWKKGCHESGEQALCVVYMAKVRRVSVPTNTSPIPRPSGAFYLKKEPNHTGRLGAKGSL